MINLDRAQVVHDNFIKCLQQGRLPKPRSTTTPAVAGLSDQGLWDLFDAQGLSRHLDLQARKLKEQNLGFYTIGSSGHEGNAAIAHAFNVTDMAFLHYRSGAFMLERARKADYEHGLRDQILSLLASSEDPISGGRHKVFGSLALNVPPQTSTIASHLPKAFGMAYAVTLAKKLGHKGTVPNDSVVLCSFGDASFNHSTAQGAFNAALWVKHAHIPLPLVFICEDNEIGISVPTPKHWIAERMATEAGFYYCACDGLNLADVFLAAKRAEYHARINKVPVFLHMKTVRLLGHAGSDIEFHYRSEQEIEAWEQEDPLLHSARLLLETGITDTMSLIARYKMLGKRVEKMAKIYKGSPKLNSAKAIMTSIIPPVKTKSIKESASEERRRQVFGVEYTQLQSPKTLAQLLNFALTDILLEYPNVLMLGEDVGKKGGVYRISKDLQQRFGAKRVFDTILDEQTILGTAIGLAHQGFVPIPEIQFLAYTHNAADQIRGEAATLSFFSKGQFTNPMVIRIPGLAYQKGFGGHFHNDNALAFLREIPGIIILCPSHGRDAVLQLREAVRLAEQEQRVVIYLEPIALYRTKDLHHKEDGLWLHAYPPCDETLSYHQLGITPGDNVLCLVSYGNGHFLCQQAALTLQNTCGVIPKIIDLRCLAPLNEEALVQAMQGISNILIVDECRRTGSLSEALMVSFMERLHPLPKISRVTAEDCFIPLGTAWEHILPSKESIVEASLKLLQE